MQFVPKQLMRGNAAFFVCCVFYLLWWILAFRPTQPVKGIRSGWLLIPAFLFGLTGAVKIFHTVLRAPAVPGALTPGKIWIAAAAVYGILAFLTWAWCKRPVTTELFLIVGWTGLIFSEIHLLTGLGVLIRKEGLVYALLTLLVFLISMVTYLLYYKLDARAGFVDGMIPLLLVGVMMGILTIRLF